MLLFDYKIPVEADRALRDAYVALAFAFRRLEGSARSRDTELCSTLLKVRAEIERVLKAQDAAPAEALAAPSASQEALRDARAKIEEVRHQLAINVSIAKRDHPEGVVVEGKRFDPLPHSQEVLAGHIRDRLAELEAILDAALAQSAPVKEGE